MKKTFILLNLIFCFLFVSAQVDLSNVNSSNTWLKLGLNAGVPIAETNKLSGFALGFDASVQFLETKAYGIGLKAGYVNYFGKSLQDNFGILPLAVLFRYYPQPKGLFFGLEAGYALVNNISGTEGGVYTRPHIGWHTEKWNFFGYYDNVITEENVIDIQSIGIGLTRNIYFKK